VLSEIEKRLPDLVSDASFQVQNQRGKEAVPSLCLEFEMIQTVG